MLSENIYMKTNMFYIPFFVISSLLLVSCATPVLNKSYFLEGNRNPSFITIGLNPDQYKGRLFIFGGIIVQVRLNDAGSTIEAVEEPVDESGYFLDRGRPEGLFQALLPKNESILDPELYTRGRRVTLAAEFVEMRIGEIEDAQYQYPFFLIRQIYLWPRERQAYYDMPPYYLDPWFYPYPYYYSEPWWSSPPVHTPVPTQPPTRVPPPSRAP
jgi:outer membrane lipoprotein